VIGRLFQKQFSGVSKKADAERQKSVDTEIGVLRFGRKRTSLLAARFGISIDFDTEETRISV